MTNPQLAENLLAVIRGLPEADRHWLLLQLEQDNGDMSANTLAMPLVKRHEVLQRVISRQD